jgi:hypothetical protein
MPMGLTDDWEILRGGLRHARAMTREHMTEQERDWLNRAIAIVDQALQGR